MSMTHEDKQKLAEKIAEKAMSAKNVTYAVVLQAVYEALNARDEEIRQLRNPWITDRDPEIKGSISDSVLLLIDGLFYRVSRLERRKDGSEYWWGVDSEIEVTAWMPIPELEEGE